MRRGSIVTSSLYLTTFLPMASEIQQPTLPPGMQKCSKTRCKRLVEINSGYKQCQGCREQSTRSRRKRRHQEIDPASPDPIREAPVPPNKRTFDPEAAPSADDSSDMRNDTEPIRDAKSSVTLPTVCKFND